MGKSLAPKNISNTIKEMYETYQTQPKPGFYGITTRFPDIDAITLGLHKKDLVVTAGRPSMGKSALALAILVNLAKRQIPGFLISLETSNEGIAARLLGLPNHDSELVSRSFSGVADLPISIVDERGLSVDDLCKVCRKAKEQTPELSYIAIDYLQLIRPPERIENFYPSWILGQIVRQIRDLAGELDVVINLICQVNRRPEDRENKRPILSDLRDSGNLEEYADVAFLMYRDEYYYPEKAREEGNEGQVEIAVAKNRHGETGVARLTWIQPNVFLSATKLEREWLDCS